MMLLLLFVLLLVFIMLGMEIAFAMGISSLIYIVITQFMDFPIRFSVLSIQMVDGINSFTLIAVPIFILMGEIMNKGGVTRHLVNFAESLVGHFRGGLGQTSIVVNMIMAGMSGSAVADAAATGSVLIPAMKEEKYDPEFSAALIASASTIGPVIPPSIPLVIIGAMTGTSITQLFIGGAVPGFLVGLALMLFTALIAKKRGFPVKKRVSARTMLTSSLKAIIPLGLPIVVLGSLITGITTPTESAVIGVVYALLITLFVYRTLTLKDIYEVVVESAVISMAIGFTLSTGIVFGWLATAEQLGPKLISLLHFITDNKYVMILLINILLLIMGMVIEAIPIILLMTPILFPLATSIGMNPIQFGVMMCLNLMIGLLTPPIGLNLFIMSSIAKVPIEGVIKEIWPFLIVMGIVLALIVIFPVLVLWLPALVVN